MAITDFNRIKKLDVESVSGTPTISRTVCLKLTSGDDSTTGTGEIVLDWANISSEADIGVYDENDNLLDYYFESFDATNEKAVIWVHRDWVRDGSTQAQIVYGNGSSDQSVSASTVFDKESDLEAGYLFNESSGDLLDVTSNNNDGTVYGATQGEDGVVGGAYSFDGTDDEIEVENFTGNGASALTILTWVKSDQTGVDASICGTKEESSTGDLDAGYRYDSDGFVGGGTNVIKFIVRNQSGDHVTGETESDVQTTDWQLLAMTWESGQAPKMWANGSELSNTDEPDSLSGDANIPNFYLGTGPKRNDGIWDGLIGSSHVLTSALSSDEILAYYDATKSSPDFFSQQAGEDTEEPVEVTSTGFMAFM